MTKEDTNKKTTSKEAARGCCAWSFFIFLLVFVSQLVFIILKATGSVDWTWVATFSPTIACTVGHILVYAVVGFAAILDKA